MDVPVGHHHRPDQVQAGLELPPRPAGQVAIEPADAGRIRDEAVLPLDPALVTPGGELPHEGVGNLPRQGLPRLAILVGEDLLELRYAEVSKVHETGRIVDDQADRHAIAGVEHTDPGRRAGGPWPRILSRGTGLGERHSPAVASMGPGRTPSQAQAKPRAGEELSTVFQPHGAAPFRAHAQPDPGRLQARDHEWEPGRTRKLWLQAYPERTGVATVPHRWHRPGRIAYREQLSRPQLRGGLPVMADGHGRAADSAARSTTAAAPAPAGLVGASHRPHDQGVATPHFMRSGWSAG